MTDEMGGFRVDVEVENLFEPERRAVLRTVLIDTGAELSCFPAEFLDSIGLKRYQLRRFRQADGSTFQRWVGPARVHVADATATDDVIFGEPGDLILLGSRSLEGLNLVIDPVAKRLSDAGPIIIAAFAA